MEDRAGNAIRRGYTFVEVLAVAVGIVLLAALTLPAVQQARETARDDQCRNQLKQLGLAIHNYYDAYRMFPPGWITRRQNGAGQPSTGWQSMLLPWLGQVPLYNRLEMTHGVYRGRDQSLLQQSIAIYRCPADSLGGANVLRGGWGTSNYAGNFGAAPIPRWSESFSNNYWPGQCIGSRIAHQSDVRLSGVFFMNRGSRFSEISDGVSNTFLIGERSVFGGGGIWPGPRSNFHESDVVADASYSSPLGGRNPAFSSRHEGSVNFVMCDGAVHDITIKIDSRPDLGIYQRLAGECDGLPLDF